MMHSGQGFQSHLSKSMHSYLSNKNRVQPIIGLNSVTELCTDDNLPVYLCDVCILRISLTDIKTHIIGSRHRYNYIKSCHAYELGAGTDLAPQAWHLLEVAKLIEKKEGTGTVQVLHVHEDIYKDLISQPVLNVLAEVKQINNQPNITEFQLPVYDYSNYYGILEKAPRSYTPAIRPASCVTGSSVQNAFKTQSPVQCWLPTHTLPPDREPTAHTSARIPVHVGTSNPCEHPVPNYIPNLSLTTATGAFQIGNPIGDSVLNVAMHEDNALQTRGNGLSPKSLSSNTVQTIQPKRVAQWQNKSLKVTITQKPNPEDIKGRKNVQDHLTPLKLISTGSHIAPITWNEDQCLINNYRTSEEPFRDTAGEEEWRSPRPFTADDTFFENDITGQYQQLQDHSEESFFPLEYYTEESPEHYSGTEPLIGLHTVIKCQNIAEPPSCCYLCQTCSMKMLKSNIIQHLISPLHQTNYINFQYPRLSQYYDGVQSLQTTAMKLEREEGRGQMEVRRLSACLFNKLLEKDFHWSMEILNSGLSEESLNQKTLRKRSRMTPDFNVSMKRSAGYSGFTVDCNGNKATGKPPVSKKRSKKKRVSLNKVIHPDPMFKVSLSLTDRPLLVDRLPQVRANVAPEIE